MLLQTGAEIGVLRTLPFDKINVNMFLIEMFHFTGEKEKQVMLNLGRCFIKYDNIETQKRGRLNPV